MKALISLFVLVACVQPASAFEVDPRLVQARKVWENYRQFKSETEADRATQYRNLKEIYALFKAEELTAVDRIGKLAATLRCAYLEMPQVSLLAYEDGIRRSLIEFQNVIHAARSAAEKSEGYETLARQYGVNVAAPAPPFGLIEDVIESGILTSLLLPSTGSAYGTALSKILKDAIPLYGPEEQEFLKVILSDLVEVDGSNLAGSSKLHNELQKLRVLLSGNLVSSPDRAETLRQELTASGQRWRAGIRSISAKCNSLSLAGQYADQLYVASLQAEVETVREELLFHSLYCLRDTLSEAYSTCSDWNGLAQLNSARSKLLDRLLDWGHAQWIRAINAPKSDERRLLLDKMTRRLSLFVDDSSEFLRQEQQVFLHAYLAQAFIIAAEDRKAMAHYERSKSVLPLAQLEQLAMKRSVLGAP